MLITYLILVPTSEFANKNALLYERFRAALMPTCARDLGWKRLDIIVTTDSPKNKESSSTDTPNLHTPHLDRLAATVRYYYRVRCPGVAHGVENRRGSA